MTKKILLSTILTLYSCLSMLNAQIKVYSNGTTHIGNTAEPLFDPATACLEVNMQKTVVKCTIASQPSFNRIKGFQFIPSLDMITAGSAYLTFPEPVMALTGLSDGGASIGTAYNTMNIVYSKYYFSNGNYIGALASSDANLKTNIRDLSSESERALKQPSISDRVLSLRPVRYDFVKTSSGEDVSKNPAYQNRTGFIAQEVAKQFPDLVAINENGLYSLDYVGLIPYLTKTIQEQNERIEHLEQQISLYATDFAVDGTENSFQKTQSAVEPASEDHMLFQNTPNPFNVSTSIAYRLSGDAKNASICIYNLNGKQLQCYNLPATQGESAIEVRAQSLQSGMYLYALIVGDKLIATKRMVLTE